jgi:hypothetical protein
MGMNVLPAVIKILMADVTAAWLEPKWQYLWKKQIASSSIAKIQNDAIPMAHKELRAGLPQFQGKVHFVRQTGSRSAK